MKILLSLVAAFALTFSAFSAPAKAVVTFDDLFATDPFAYEIIYLYEEGIISGYPDGTFRPYDPVTRGQAITMIGRALELDGTKRNTPFSDVRAGNPFSGYIASGAEEGIISGFQNGMFKPHLAITRGQSAVMLDRAFYFPDAPANSFKDMAPTMYSFDAVSRLAHQGTIQGYPDNTFKQDLNVTRAQFSAFLARTLEPSFIPEKRALLHTANDILADLKAKDFASVASYVSDQEGLIFCPYSGGCLDDQGISFSKAELPGFMENSQQYEWGFQDGSGFPISLTPAEYYNEYLMDATYEQKERYGRTEQPMTQEQIRDRFPEATVVEYYHPGTSQYGYMDWQNLNMVFERNSNGNWILVALVNNRWTI